MPGTEAPIAAVRADDDRGGIPARPRATFLAAFRRSAARGIGALVPGVDGRAALGILGEDLVARHLAAAGCRILHRRWRNRFGELDLVADDRGEVVFVEVKTRRGAAFGMPEDAVTAAKRSHLRAAARAYLATHRLDGRAFRIDVAAVTFSPFGRPRIDYFSHAVGEEG